jgi:hypothetical protein
MHIASLSRLERGVTTMTLVNDGAFVPITETSIYHAAL